MVKRTYSTIFNRRSIAAGLTLVMAGGLLGACSSSGESQAEQRVLRIGMVYGSGDMESYFRQQYTDTFEYTHPNIELQIVPAVNYNDQMFEQPTDGSPMKQPDPYEKIKELMTGQNPVDVLVFDYNMLKRMTQDNLLQQLDPLIAKDKFDLSDYVPTVINGIKDAGGDNNIYALTPTFSGSALFYNKKIFQDAGVTPPSDGMQWPDVFNLARQVTKGSGETKIFGFGFNRWQSDGYSDIQQFAAPLQLKLYDDKGETMLVDNPKWNNVWTTISGLYKDKIVPGMEDMNKINEAIQKKMGGNNSYYNPFQGDLFLSGHQAMVIAEYGYVNQLKLAKDNGSKIKGFTVPDWDVVTVPTHSEAPDIGMSSYLGQLMGINSKAQNDTDAWEFIKFLNSREWAKLKSRSMYEIPSRQEFIKPIDGMSYNIKAFYTLKPVPPASMDLERLNREKPRIYQLYSIGSELFQQVLQGNKAVEAALKEYETRGNALLQKLKTNPNGDMGPVGPMGPADGGGASTEAVESEG